MGALYYAPSGLIDRFVSFTRGDARASLALAPGYHISRLRRCRSNAESFIFHLKVSLELICQLKLSSKIISKTQSKRFAPTRSSPKRRLRNCKTKSFL